jgi:hypothetical protein
MIHLLVALAFYFLPTLIGCGRHLDSRAGIALLNFFFGWTVIGWFVALIWAVTAPSPYYFAVPYPPYPPRPPQFR